MPDSVEESHYGMVLAVSTSTPDAKPGNGSQALVGTVARTVDPDMDIGLPKTEMWRSIPHNQGPITW